MKVFTYFESASEVFIKLTAQKFGLNLGHAKDISHPREDFLLVSQKYPIFVVADGVTLIQFLLQNKNYPNPSPAGKVAQLFCEKFVEIAEARYPEFTEQDILDAFRQANVRVKEYNTSCGRTKETIDYWDTDFYAATAAFAVAKENVVYWGSIGDSYIAHFDDTGKMRFKSPDINAKATEKSIPFMGDPRDMREKTMHAWHTRRNVINHAGKLVGYGVVTGEDNANRYLNFGQLTIQTSDFVTVLTDGFENHIQLPEFLKIFKEWPADIDVNFRKFIAQKTSENPERYGSEKSLIVFSK